MSTWWLQPRDSLLARDGRPTDGGAAMTTLPFPWPSTTAGFLRNRAGIDDAGRFHLDPQEALKIPVRGPLLAGRHAVTGEGLTFYAPAPADAVWFEAPQDEDTKRPRLALHRLAPGARPGGALTDDALGALELLDWATAPHPDKAKPAPGPAFWTWTELEAWLKRPPTAPALHEKGAYGLQALPVEERMHVGINHDTQAADDGVLFRTRMLRFATPREDARRQQLGLVVACEDARVKALAGTLGGERRAAFVEPLKDGLPPCPKLDAPSRRLRVLLLTPALFDAGATPGEALLGGARLLAAAVGRPESVSGWDMEARGPRATRRMVPAGSVFWVELPQGADANAWAQARWLRSISDQEQDRRDGFGLCVVGEV